MPRLSQRDRRALQWIFVAIAPLAAAALWASFHYSVDAMAEGAPWRAVGLEPVPCPGCLLCGLSRAFTATSHGELARALAFNPLVAVLYPVFWATALAGPLLAFRLVRPQVRAT